MEMSFQNEGFHQYVILNTSELNMESYEINMLMQFRGNSLLPLELYGQNGKIQIRYDITGSATLEQVSKEHELKGTFLRMLFQTIWNCYGELEEYLLPLEGILLNPEMIYYQPGKKQIGFCYLPGQENSFKQNFLNLIEFCMKHTDHEDSKAVLFIYGLYRYVQNGHMSREEIQSYIHSSDTETGNNEYTKKESVRNNINVSEQGAFSDNVSRVEKEYSGNNVRRLEKIFTDNYNSAFVHETAQYESEALKKTEGIGHEMYNLKEQKECQGQGNKNRSPRRKSMLWKKMEEREGNQKTQKITFYLYGSGFILSVCAMIISGIRFFRITGLERDLKLFIILIFASMIFLYSTIRSKGKTAKGGEEAGVKRSINDNIVEEKRIEGKELVTEKTPLTKQNIKQISNWESEPATGQTTGQAYEPALRQTTGQAYEPATGQTTGQVFGQIFEQWGETQVLQHIASESNSHDNKDSSNSLFWVMESLNSSVPSIQLNRLPGVVGRKTEDVDYVVGGEGISRRHAMLFLSGSSLYVEDLNSTNGTYVDNIRLNPGEPFILKEEAVLRIGPNKYRIRKRNN